MARKNKSKKNKKIKEIKSDFKKATSTAIVAALGLIIALAWRDVITDFVETLTRFSPIQGKLISAFIITIIGVLGIWITTKTLNEKNE
ncbi:MAG TPA: DUF5654 family protein [Candidatus Nanoarchaeia archaeon]|nr:DUF5654 family protein [Candidatus Nanoarchaeia archaeon]